jgi:hypothetical protein
VGWAGLLLPPFSPVPKAAAQTRIVSGGEFQRRRELNVVYEANLNGERKRACEIMQFDATGGRSEARLSMGWPSEAVRCARALRRRAREALG